MPVQKLASYKSGEHWPAGWVESPASWTSGWSYVKKFARELERRDKMSKKKEKDDEKGDDVEEVEVEEVEEEEEGSTDKDAPIEKQPKPSPKLLIPPHRVVKPTITVPNIKDKDQTKHQINDKPTAGPSSNKPPTPAKSTTQVPLLFNFTTTKPVPFAAPALQPAAQITEQGGFVFPFTPVTFGDNKAGEKTGGLLKEVEDDGAREKEEKGKGKAPMAIPFRPTPQVISIESSPSSQGEFISIASSSASGSVQSQSKDKEKDIPGMDLSHLSEEEKKEVMMMFYKWWGYKHDERVKGKKSEKE